MAMTRFLPRTFGLRSVALGLTVAVALILGLSSPARGHEPGFSSVRVVLLPDVVEVDLSVPYDLLRKSAEIPFTNNPEAAVAAFGSELEAYFVEHVQIEGADGTPWAAEVSEVEVTVLVNDTHVDAVVALTPPEGQVGEFDLRYDVIIDRDDTHEVLVGVVTADGDLTGATLRSGRTLLSISEEGSATAGATAFLSIVELGFDHVVEGADHILFLIVLVLPAPLVIAAETKRWEGRASTGKMLAHILGVSTAFLIGHSATLALATLDWVSAPAGPVEVAIAASIGVGAIHAIRPIVRRGEVLIAGLFGLVHGLAFAEILESLSLDGTPQLTSLLAFNIGVELAQLAAVLLFFPGIFLLSRTRVYNAFRVGGAVLSLLAALGWIADRTGVLVNPLEPIETAAIEHPIIVIVVFTAVAGAVWFGFGRQSPPAKT